MTCPFHQVTYAERWGLEPCALPVIVNIAAAPCDTLDFSPLDESSSLIFYNVNKHPCGGRQKKARVLQAGTPLGLMAYLYSRCVQEAGQDPEPMGHEILRAKRKQLIQDKEKKPPFRMGCTAFNLEKCLIKDLKLLYVNCHLLHG